MDCFQSSESVQIIHEIIAVYRNGIWLVNCNRPEQIQQFSHHCCSIKLQWFSIYSLSLNSSSSFCQKPNRSAAPFFIIYYNIIIAPTAYYYNSVGLLLQDLHFPYSKTSSMVIRGRCPSPVASPTPQQFSLDARWLTLNSSLYTKLILNKCCRGFSNWIPSSCYFTTWEIVK